MNDPCKTSRHDHHDDRQLKSWDRFCKLLSKLHGVYNKLQLQIQLLTSES